MVWLWWWGDADGCIGDGDGSSTRADGADALPLLRWRKERKVWLDRAGVDTRQVKEGGPWAVQKEKGNTACMAKFDGLSSDFGLVQNEECRVYFLTILIWFWIEYEYCFKICKFWDVTLCV
jgi:hypothetical protein